MTMEEKIEELIVLATKYAEFKQLDPDAYVDSILTFKDDWDPEPIVDKLISYHEEWLR